MTSQQVQFLSCYCSPSPSDHLHFFIPFSYQIWLDVSWGTSISGINCFPNLPTLLKPLINIFSQIKNTKDIFVSPWPLFGHHILELFIVQMHPGQPRSPVGPLVVIRTRKTKTESQIWCTSLFVLFLGENKFLTTKNLIFKIQVNLLIQTDLFFSLE